MIGLFPAAGHATRLRTSLQIDHQAGTGAIQSKEIIPVTNLDNPEGSAVAVGDYLIDAYHRAGIEQILLITRPEKEDLLQHYQNSTLDILPLLLEHSPSPLHTIDFAYTRTRQHIVALGFPDIIVQPHGVFQELTTALNTQLTCDVVLGLFPVQSTQKFDMVAYDTQASPARVSAIEIKPHQTQLDRTWVCAVWRPSFTELIHRFVAAASAEFSVGRQQGYSTTPGAKQQSELHVGDALIAALDAGMDIRAVDFSGGRVLDVGTPEDLELARSPGLVNYFNGPEEP